MHPSLDIALAVSSRGLPVFPCSSTKRPAISSAKGGHGFLDAVTDPAAVEALFLRAPKAPLVGVPTGAGSFDVLDVDYRHGGGAWEDAHKDNLPDTLIHSTQSGGRHYVFQHAEGVRNSGSLLAPGIDIRGSGGYVIMPPSPGYEIINDAPIAEWPDWLLQLVLARDVKDERPAPQASPATKPTERLAIRATAYCEAMLKTISAAADGSKHDTLRDIARLWGGYLHLTGYSVQQAVDRLVAALPATVKDWASANKTAKDGLTHGMLSPLELQEREGYQHRREAQVTAKPNGFHPPEPPDIEEPLPPEIDPSTLSDHGVISEGSVAAAFGREYGAVLRFDHDAGAWFHWNGAIWKRESTKLAYRWAHQIAKALAAEAGKSIVSAGKAAFAAGVERIAQSDRAFAITSEIWDADPWLLGTPGGTVDLRTGELRPARQSDFITKQTSVTPAETPDCPIWLEFLDQATQGDLALIRFLRQWFGYCLTGETTEQGLIFVYGPGGNGKGIVMNTVFRIAGAYATNAAIDTFVASRGDKHSTDLAMLAGARMVMATEVDEGQVWAEARIKLLTGRDPITARFMRRDNFTFIPRFKLSISGNHKPALRNVDDAGKRRFNIVPFLFKPAKDDTALAHKIEPENPQVLRWLIDGCLDWQKNGLVRPPVVLEATKDYFEAQDFYGRWLADCCILDPTLDVKPIILFHSFQEWSRENGEEIADNRRLRGMLERTQGVRYVTTRGTQRVRGIGLKAPKTTQYRDV